MACANSSIPTPAIVSAQSTKPLLLAACIRVILFRDGSSSPAEVMLTLVTGATGLVGNNVVRLLVVRGDAVRVLTRNGSGGRALEGLPVEIAHGDVRQPETIRAACRGVQRVIHAAAEVQLGWKGLDLARAI